MATGVAGQTGRAAVSAAVMVTEQGPEIVTTRWPCMEVWTAQDHQLSQMVVLWTDASLVTMVLMCYVKDIWSCYIINSDKQLIVIQLIRT